MNPDTLSRLLDEFDFRFEPVDRDLRILPSDSRFWTALGQVFPEGPIPLDDAFPEFVGLEDELAAASRKGNGSVRMTGVRRGERYFNLRVVFPSASAAGTEDALIVLEDVTEALNTQQALTQDRNEITFLSAALRERNAELTEAKARLDELLGVIREQNHDLESKVRRRTKQLHDSRLSVITTLARVAEFRDTDTGGHIYRIGRSSVLIGKKLGLAPPECETLFYATLLHDVGKIGVPDSVLLKPAGLSDEEWEVMRNHTRIGGELLKRDDHLLFQASKDVALHHHEKWNGKGYPEGIGGKEIPLMSRICSVADVYDALTSERPYKRAWGEDRALSFMRSQSGLSFDPEMVACFESVLDDIRALRGESAELELLLPEFD